MDILDLINENIKSVETELADLKAKKEAVVNDHIDELNARLQEKAQAYIETLKAETIKELFGEELAHYDIRIEDKEHELARYKTLLPKEEVLAEEPKIENQEIAE